MPAPPVVVSWPAPLWPTGTERARAFPEAVRVEGAVPDWVRVTGLTVREKLQVPDSLKASTSVPPAL